MESDTFIIQYTAQKKNNNIKN